MEVYATAEDYRAMHPGDTLTDERLNLLLETASVQLRREFARRGESLENADDDLKFDLKAVCIAMVHRSVVAEETGPYSQMSQTAGPYTASATLANPNGDMYLTSNERKRLGLTGGSMYTIRPKIEGADDTW